MPNKTTLIVCTTIGTILTLSGITLEIETLTQRYDSINMPISLFMIIIGITIIIGTYNEYTTKKDIQCVKNSTQSKTSFNDSTNSNNTSTNSNNNSNNEQ